MHWTHYFKMMALNNILMLFKLWQTMYFHDEKPTCNLEAIRGCLAAYRRNLVEEFPTGRAQGPTGRARPTGRAQGSTGRAQAVYTNSPNSFQIDFLYCFEAQ